VTSVFVGEGSADSFSSKALRAGMGSTFRLPIGFRALATEITTLRRMGVFVWAAAMGGKAFDRIDWRQPSAVVVGNEGAGVPDALIRICSGKVSVPMAGRVESLNVGVAAGVILFEAARQRRSTVRS
jgi:tRNA G18 (ribose-2'-O)-methylase SpoU